MRVAVVGAGAAGLTAAHRLRQRGHEVTVFEAAEAVGGRVRTTHLGPDQWLDEGASRLGTFCPSTLALFDELGERGLLRAVEPPREEVILDGAIHTLPGRLAGLRRTDLLAPSDAARFIAWTAALAVGQPDGLRIDRRHDAESALAALEPIGRHTRERLVRPILEGTLRVGLESMSGALVRAWLRALSSGSFLEVDGGMDAPWRRLADSLDVRTRTPVVRVAPRDTGVVVAAAGEDLPFDSAVVAVPAPVARLLVDEPAAPTVLRNIAYAPHVSIYAAARGVEAARTGEAESRRGEGATPPGGGMAHAAIPTTHRGSNARHRLFVQPADLVASIERGPGSPGEAPGAPDGTSWGLVSAPAAASGPLLDLPDEIVVDRLWREARSLDQGLFPLSDAGTVRVIRWRNAVPIVGPGYYGRLAAVRQGPPIVFAGDWLVQPCVEGAVRSGNAAASFLTAGH